MSSNRYPPSPAAMASRLGHHLLLSLGVATAAALLAALPALLSGAGPGPRPVWSPAGQVALAMVPHGKIVERLDQAGAAADAGRAAGSPVTPAVLAMPMSLSWPEPGDWMPAQLAVLGRHRLPAGEGAARPTLRRTVAAPLRIAAPAGPLVILPPAPATAIEAAATAAGSQDESWSRLVVAPAAKLVDAVSDAAGSVQAAGSWGLSRATSLLPHW